MFRRLGDRPVRRRRSLHFLPEPYFARYATRQGARPFAAKLAEALGVSLVDTT